MYLFSIFLLQTLEACRTKKEKEERKTTSLFFLVTQAFRNPIVAFVCCLSLSFSFSLSLQFSSCCTRPTLEQ